MNMLIFVLLGIGAGAVVQAGMLCCRLLEAMSRAGYELAASVDMSVGGGGMDSKFTSSVMPWSFTRGSESGLSLTLSYFSGLCQ